MNTITKLAICCAFAMTLGVAVGQTGVKPAVPLTVIMDGEPVTFEGAKPQTVMGRIMVPIRGVFEKIGAYVEYDAATHIIRAHVRNESVEIRLGNRIANKNGAEILMEVPATVINGNALVPLRFLAESLGSHVEYDQPTNTVTITSGRHSLADPVKSGGGGGQN